MNNNRNTSATSRQEGFHFHTPTGYGYGTGISEGGRYSNVNQQEDRSSIGSRGQSSRYFGLGSYDGRQIPSSFHEYHWRTGTAGSTTSAWSRTSTIASGSTGQGSDSDIVNPDLIPSRCWEHTNLGALVHANRKHETTAFGGEGTKFTLMSYNILAPSLLEKHSELYTNCTQDNLEWETRVTRLFEEVEAYQPDIVCFQEMEAIQFDNIFLHRFKTLGFRGIYKKKTGDKDDGCAIFYKTSKFLLIDKLEVEFFQPHVPLLNRDNIGLLIKLETRGVEKRQKLVVGTTHLLFNLKRHDVRLAQTQLLLAEIDRIAFCGFDKDGRTLYHPILMTGDFNSKPYNSVMKLFSDGQLQYLDENGDIIKLLKRKEFDGVLPSHLGISDQCQHYKVVLERLKRWKSEKRNNFESDLKAQESLVNISPYAEPSPNSLTCLISPPEDDLISLLSPVTEGITTTSSVMESFDTQFLNKAAAKIAELKNKPNLEIPTGVFRDTMFSNNSSKWSAHLDGHVLDELKSFGQYVTFGSGRLTHNFHLRDVHSPKLDRRSNEGAVTTNQGGWVCVDFIFQSMVWNDSLKRRIEGKLKLIRRLGLFNRNQCKTIGRIPNDNHPSDHFPLISEFVLRQ